VGITLRKRIHWPMSIDRLGPRAIGGGASVQSGLVAHLFPLTFALVCQPSEGNNRSYRGSLSTNAKYSTASHNESIIDECSSVPVNLVMLLISTTGGPIERRCLSSARSGHNSDRSASSRKALVRECVDAASQFLFGRNHITSNASLKPFGAHK